MATQPRDRQAPGGHRGPGQHGRALHRQDRHPHRGQDPPRAAVDVAGAESDRGARAGLPQQLTSRPASASPLDEAILARQAVDPAPWTQDGRSFPSTSSAAAFRCCSTAGTAACWSSRARPRTSSRCATRYESADGAEPRPSTTRARAAAASRFEALGRGGLSGAGHRMAGSCQRPAACQRRRRARARASRVSPPSSIRPRPARGTGARRAGRRAASK